jgi:type I restriction enzyme S subunit
MIGEGKTRGQAAILKIEASHNQNTAAIRVDSNVYKSELLYYYLVLKYEDNRKVGSGNNQKALNKERVKGIPIPLPPIAEQNCIVQEIENRLSVADKMEESITQSLQQVEALRQSILKKAFEGRLV